MKLSLGIISYPKMASEFTEIHVFQRRKSVNGTYKPDYENNFDVTF